MVPSCSCLSRSSRPVLSADLKGSISPLRQRPRNSWDPDHRASHKDPSHGALDPLMLGLLREGCKVVGQVGGHCSPTRQVRTSQRCSLSSPQEVHAEKVDGAISITCPINAQMEAKWQSPSQLSACGWELSSASHKGLQPSSVGDRIARCVGDRGGGSGQFL